VLFGGAYRSRIWVELGKEDHEETAGAQEDNVAQWEKILDLQVSP
jgi:hypothetical protein